MTAGILEDVSLTYGCGFLNKIEKLTTLPTNKHNLSLSEQCALRELSMNKNLIIKPSDKGGNIVLMDRKMYVSMCMDHLNDPLCYRKLTNDPTLSYIEDLKKLLNQKLEHEIISRDEFRYILPNPNPTIATFYCLPKVHKDQQQPPGRPIVSGNGSLTENASKYIEKLLHPFVL
ncbi:Hypothetical predicted protein, partial [Pelobates cultripes]